MIWASLWSLKKPKNLVVSHAGSSSFTSRHLAYKVVYLSAESFMTREAVKVSLADCLDVAANEKTLIS